MKYPNEFLGRCQICLDNAMLSSEPCKPGYGNGQPLQKKDCPIYEARKRYDAKRKPPEDQSEADPLGIQRGEKA